MPYATPAQVIAEYGLKEVTQLLSDEQQLLTEQLLLDAMAVAAGGQWSELLNPAEINAATAALARFNRKLDTQSSFMDGFLRSAVSLPLSAGNANTGTLNECCMALTRCGLSDDPDNATERMDECCATWRKWLRDVANGVVSLVNSAGQEVPGKSRVRQGAASSAYDWPAHGAAR